MNQPAKSGKIPELMMGVKNRASLSACKDYADGVYFSVDRFSLRARACDITLDDLNSFVTDVKEQDMNAYLTLNTVIYPDDLPELDEVIDAVASSDVDAVIAWDPAVITKAVDAGLRVHISTQANVSNWQTVNFYASLGASRVVLARELSLEQIKDIRQNTDTELEVFIHGAMCQAISGRCYLSAYILGKSGNCGECSQPCRWGWKLVGEDGSEVDIEGKYLLSARDLCMIEHIPELIDAGVDAFKVEGRLRDTRYTSTVSRCYREALDAYREGTYTQEKAASWKEEMASVFNRGFSTGFYFGVPGPDGMAIERDMNISVIKRQAVGVVTNYYRKQGAAEVKLLETSLEVGDDILIEGKNTYLEQKVKEIRNDDGPVQNAKPGDVVGLAIEGKVRENDRVYKLEVPA
ncbi:peptidase U32 [Methanococcoides methylutens]|uniref:Peptidase U32 n=1 Tax=Methanococcoides methylutens TaxID=2226 RepID=A0A099SZ30_METMT|nr:U32 family peptidase [Methanococcoides methylutens]KGK97959.1 peptidase U32 [Methanococcoides methylutens]